MRAEGEESSWDVIVVPKLHREGEQPAGLSISSDYCPPKGVDIKFTGRPFLFEKPVG